MTEDEARKSDHAEVVAYRGPVKEQPRIRPWGQAIALYIAVFFAVGLGMMLALVALGILLKLLSWMLS